MKILHKYILGLSCLSAMFALTSCVDETEPTDFATQTQASASNASLKAMVYGMPASLNKVDEDLLDNNNWHAVFGYSSIMIMRDLQTGDRVLTGQYAAHYEEYINNQYMGKRYIYMSYPWSVYYNSIMAANKVIGSVDPETANDTQKAYYSTAKAFRAMLYLDVARTYEFLPNDKFSSSNDEGNNVLGLTAPIVTEDVNEEAARKNPRATHDEMAEFILCDLDEAEKYIPTVAETNILPDLSCVYGLKARYYMWIEDYTNASKYAKLAIDNANVGVMTQSECLDPQKGFNDISKWMWGSQLTSEDDAVSTGIVNWTSWMSNETDFGYAGTAEASILIDSCLYSKISDTDFRKLEFLAPDGEPLSGQEFLSSPAYTEHYKQTITYDLLMRPLSSIKFRPAEGNSGEYQVGAASAYPLMRLEEMYFIYAEAEAHLNAANGKAILENFMTTVGARDPQYTCTASSTDDVVNEIVLQKRIELFGEGQTFFDIKRLNMSVDRTYEHSNWPDLAKFKTNGRPAWMNWVFPMNEENNNAALKGYNNPDPSDAY